MWFVYIIQSEINNSIYIGFTDNIKRRTREHNLGKEKSTKHNAPYKLKYFECYCNKTIARKREIELKNNSFKKKELLERLQIK
jgi:putative endonuclease